MRDNEYDLHLVTWLGDGPTVAPDRVVEAALAHVQAHPRRGALRVHWSEAMHAVLSGRRAVPAFRFALLIAAVAVAAAFGGMIYLSSQNVILTPTPTATPTSSPTATPANYLDAIDGNLEAWKWGNVSDVPKYYASGAGLHGIITNQDVTYTDFTDTDLNPFVIRPEARGWEVWGRDGPIFGEEPLWAHPTDHGLWSRHDGFAVYRLDVHNRIETEWVLVSNSGVGGDWTVPVPTGPAPPEVVTFLDGCLVALDTGDQSAFLACYAPDSADERVRKSAAYRISAGSGDGSWTGEYIGLEAIANTLGETVSARLTIERTGDVLIQGNLVAYPFRGSGATGPTTGIAVFQLVPDHSRILYQWSFSGS